MSKDALRALIILWFVGLLNYYDRLLVPVVSQPLRQEFGLTDTQYGLLTGPAFVALYAVSSVMYGWLADRHSRKRVLAGALTLWSVMTAITGLATSFPLLALGRAGVGVGEGGSNPAGMSLLADYFPPQKRSTALSVFVGGGMVGLCLSFLIGSWIEAQWGWRTVFLVAGIPGVLLAVVMMFVVKEPVRGQFDAGAPAQISYLDALKRLRRNRPYPWIALASAMGTFGSLGMLIWLPQFFIRSHGLTNQQVGFLFGPAAAFGLIIGVVFGGRIGDALARTSLAKPLLFCGAVNVCLIPVFSLMLWTGSLPLALACTFVGMVVTASYGPVVQAAMQNVSDPDARGTAVGFFNLTVAIIGQGALPYFVGVLSDALKPRFGDEALRLALTVAAVVYTLIAALLFFRSYYSARGHFRRQAAAAAS